MCNLQSGYTFNFNTMRKYIIPVSVGILSCVIPTIVGFGIFTWQYWVIGLTIILSSWFIIPLDQYINRNNDKWKNYE